MHVLAAQGHVLTCKLQSVGACKGRQCLHRFSHHDVISSCHEEMVPCRVPLQYLNNAAHWDDMVLAVGPGVLIPRPETESLLQFATEVSLNPTRGLHVFPPYKANNAQHKVLPYCTLRGCFKQNRNFVHYVGAMASGGSSAQSACRKKWLLAGCREPATACKRSVGRSGHRLWGSGCGSCKEMQTSETGISEAWQSRLRACGITVLWSKQPTKGIQWDAFCERTV